MSLAVAISPGPSWIYILSLTVEQGYISGLIAIVGNAVGIMLHVVIAVLGLTAVFQYPIAIFLLKWVGTFYLAYLAIRTVKNQFVLTTSKLNSNHFKRVFFEGFLVNALNPKVSLLMLALLPQFINPNDGHVQLQIAFLGFSHVIIASMVLTTMVFLINKVAHVFTNSVVFQQIFRWFSASILLIFSIKLAFF